MSEYHEITKLHQTMILDGGGAPDVMPPEILRNIETAKSLYPSAEHKIWYGDELRHFIKEHFDEEVLWAYDSLKPYSYKSDLGRFALLYVFGGLYVDLGVYLTKKWNIPLEKGIAAFRDVPFASPSWSALQTGLLWALPGRPEFAEAIKRIIKNCRNHYYGSNPLYPTGPVPLGRSFLSVMTKRWLAPDADDQFIGECRCVTPDAAMLNVSYVSREGTVVGFRTKRIPGDLEHLGLSGCNNYNVLWNNRAIYGEDARVWKADGVSIHTTNGAVISSDGIVIQNGNTLPQSYGPHTTLQAGHYVVSVEFAEKTQFDRLRIDVTSCGQQKNLKTVVGQSHEIGADGLLSFPLILEQNEGNVEFIVHNLGNFSGSLKSFRIKETIIKTWDCNNAAIRVLNGVRTKEGIRVKRWRKGRVTYGPYINLKAGQYILKLYFSADTWFNKVVINLGAGSQHEAFLKVAKTFKDVQNPNMLEIPFTLVEDKDLVEFRLEVSRIFFGTLLEYQLLEL